MASRTHPVARVSRSGYSLLAVAGAFGMLTHAGCGGDPTPPVPAATPAVASTPAAKPKAAPKGKVQILEEDTGHNLRREKMKKG